MMNNLNLLSDIFIKQYNLSKGTCYKFECKRKSLFSLPTNKIPDLDFYQLTFIEGNEKHPFLNDLLVMLRLYTRLIIEVLLPAEEAENEILNNVWIPNRKFFEGIIYPLENDALTKVVCSKYLLLDFRIIGRIKIDNVEGIYKRSRLEWDKFLNDEELNKSKLLKDEIQKDLSSVGVPTKHWFKEIWLSYKDEMNKIRCAQIW